MKPEDRPEIPAAKQAKAEKNSDQGSDCAYFDGDDDDDDEEDGIDGGHHRESN